MSNCRGAGSADLFRNLLELVKNHRPEILILVETRVPSAHARRVLRNSRLNRIAVVEANGFAGGIWLLCDEHRVDLEVVSLNDQVITVVVKRGSIVGVIGDLCLPQAGVPRSTLAVCSSVGDGY